MLFAVIVFISAAPSPAFSAPLSLDYSLGFNGRFQLHTWTPVAVVVENRGRATRGTLEVIVTSGSEYHQNVFQTTYAKDVDIPHNSRKRYAFTVLIESFTHEMIIRLKQNKNILISQSVNLRPHFSEKSFVVVADDFVSPDILAVLPKTIDPVNVPPKFLPETWYGYDSVKMLVMKTDSIRRLRERQFQALTQWIKQGGYLITAGSLNYGSLSDQRIQSILPIRVLGQRRLFELKSLKDFCGRSLRSFESFLVLNVRMQNSDVLIREADIPIIIQKNLGVGQIIFLTFDYNTQPFSNWDGRKLFWEKALSMRSRIDPQGVSVDNNKIMDSMLANVPANFPNSKSVFVLISAYLGLLWYFMKKLRTSAERRWRNCCFILMIVFIFSLISYWRFFYPNNLKAFTTNSFCQLDVSGPNNVASAKYIIGLYALKKTTYRLGFESNSNSVTHILSERAKKKTPEPYVIHENHIGQQIISFLNKWDHSFYRVTSKVETPVVGQALLDKQHLTLAIENTLPHQIVDCLIYYNRRFVFIDDIRANKRQQIKIKLSDLRKTEMFYEKQAEHIINRLNVHATASYLKTSQRNLTEDVILGIHAKFRSKRDSVVLMGWVQGGFIQPKFEQIHPRSENLTLINWEIPVEIAS
jgi:hypothetical protein